MRKKLLLSLLIRVFFLWSHAHARFVVEKNSLKITSPPSLKGTHECALANFGIPRYGGTMVGMLSLPSSNPKACKDFTDFGLTFKPKPGMLPSFALVDRGDCYFTTKAWNAQRAGAAAIIVVNDTPGPLITMNAPEEESPSSTHLRNITVPAVLVNRTLGESLKRALSEGKMVTLALDWRETVPHPDDRVEYEFWINSSDETQIEFVKGFRGVAQIMEKKGFTQFTPRYLTWYCPDSYGLSKQCKSQCINKGRYCAPDPDPISDGYDGRDVVVQNLRQICVFRVANESKKPWVWWDYVADFSVRCGGKERKYVGECASEIIGSLGLDKKKVDACVGDLDADRENPVLREEQEAQVGKDLRGDVTILPTLVINNRQYRGKLDKGAVLKAICSGFQETTEPAICLTEDIQTNECLENNGGCWEDKLANVTACKDTFRGRVCQCPIDQGIKYVGDGYKHCEGKKSTGGFGWTLLWALIVGSLSMGAAGYALYKYRIRSYMDSEIRAIMAQYMPLDNQAEIMARPSQIQK